MVSFLFIARLLSFSLSQRKHEIRFENLKLLPPRLPVQEEQRNEKRLMPHEARLRNMTYSSQLLAHVTHRVTYQDGTSMQDEEDGGEEGVLVPIGEVPVMLRSRLCNLHSFSDNEFPLLGECPYDQVPL